MTHKKRNIQQRRGNEIIIFIGKELSPTYRKKMNLEKMANEINGQVKKKKTHKSNGKEIFNLSNIQRNFDCNNSDLYFFFFFFLFFYRKKI